MYRIPLRIRHTVVGCAYSISRDAAPIVLQASNACCCCTSHPHSRNHGGVNPTSTLHSQQPITDLATATCSLGPLFREATSS